MFEDVDNDDVQEPATKRQAGNASNMLLQWKAKFPFAETIPGAIAQSMTGQIAINLVLASNDTSLKLKLLMVSINERDATTTLRLWETLMPVLTRIDDEDAIKILNTNALSNLVTFGDQVLLFMIFCAMRRVHTIVAPSGSATTATTEASDAIRLDAEMEEGLLRATYQIMQKACRLSRTQLQSGYDAPNLGIIAEPDAIHKEIVDVAASAKCFLRPPLLACDTLRNGLIYWIPRGIHPDYIQTILDSPDFFTYDPGTIPLVLEALYSRPQWWPTYASVATNLFRRIVVECTGDLETRPDYDNVRTLRKPRVAFTVANAVTACNFPVLLGAPMKLVHKTGTSLDETTSILFSQLLRGGRWSASDLIALLEEAVHLQTTFVIREVIGCLEAKSKCRKLPRELTDTNEHGPSLLTRVCGSMLDMTIIDALLRMCDWSAGVFMEALSIAILVANERVVRAIVDLMCHKNIAVAHETTKFLKSDFEPEYPNEEHPDDDEGPEAPRRPFLEFVAQYAVDGVFTLLLETPAAEWSHSEKVAAMLSLSNKDVLNTVELTHARRRLSQLFAKSTTDALVSSHQSTYLRTISQCEQTRNNIRNSITVLLIPPQNLTLADVDEHTNAEAHAVIKELTEAAFQPGGVGFCAARASHPEMQA